MSLASSLPLGYSVSEPEQSLRPSRRVHQGQYVELRPVNAPLDIEQLFHCSHQDELYQQLWTYMPYGPFQSKQQMLDEYLFDCAVSEDPLFFTVFDKKANQARGVVSFLNIVPEHLRLELGHIWYSPQVQRSKINTEVIYLMLCEAFERLSYRRVEWKCDALNARSRAAAQRLGFSFEGVFYQHIICKKRNRDTAWFAMLQSDWPAIKANMRTYLYGESSEYSLTQLNDPLIRKHDTKEASLNHACENCNKSLPVDSSEAMICTYECTFCRDCVEEVLLNVCPNCGGGFVPRPIRPRNEWREGLSAIKQPASEKIVHSPVDPPAHRKFAQKIKIIDPSLR